MAQPKRNIRKNMSLRKPKSVYTASGNTLQQVEKFLGWHSRVTEYGTRRLMHGLIKQTQFCMSFIV